MNGDKQRGALAAETLINASWLKEELVLEGLDELEELVGAAYKLELEMEDLELEQEVEELELHTSYSWRWRS